jgi:V-type H+-transporting ATPase subunit a
MFGDIAHGLILFAFGLYLVFKYAEIKRKSSPLAMFVPHRYLFALMGFFATFCGFIYNDFLSMNLNLFGSCFDVKNAKEGESMQRIPDCVYGFGVDPVWGVA